MLSVREAIAIVLAVAIFLSPLIPLATMSEGRIVHIEIDKKRKAVVSQDYENHTPIIITGDADFISQGWNGAGTQEDPYLISGFIIQSYGTGIQIYNTTSFFVIRDCHLEPSETGFFIGISFREVSHGSIENCTIVGATRGTHLFRSNNCSLANVTVYDATTGIQVELSNHTRILDCTVYSNNNGILLSDSVDCDVIGCTVYSNRSYGAYLSSMTANCTLYANRFGWNGGFISPDQDIHARDDGENNQWYDVSIMRGNSWSGYSGIVSYVINGTANSIDRYPSPLIDVNSPTVDSPNDVRFEEGETGYSITWSPEDELPHRYEIQKDGAVQEQGTWDGGAISFEITGLTLGAFNFTLQVEDGTGNKALDTVFVIVIMSIFGGIGTERVVAAAAISVLSVFVVILVIKRMR